MDRFDRMDARFDSMDRHLERIDRTLETSSRLFELMHERLEHLEDGQKQRWDVEWPARGILPLRMRGIRQDSLRYGDTR